MHTHEEQFDEAVGPGRDRSQVNQKNWTRGVPGTHFHTKVPPEVRKQRSRAKHKQQRASRRANRG